MGQTSVIRTTIKIKGDLKKKSTSAQDMSNTKWTKKAKHRTEECSVAHLTNIRLVARICEEYISGMD